MHRVSVAILHCAEYNFEKLKQHWGEPESPEQALRWNLECGITKCIGLLLLSETYHWNKNSICRCWNIHGGKNAPTKVRKVLIRLMDNSAYAETEIERIGKLRKGIEDTIVYLQRIKADKNYLNSTTLQDIYKYLKSLLEMKAPQ